MLFFDTEISPRNTPSYRPAASYTTRHRSTRLLALVLTTATHNQQPTANFQPLAACMRCAKPHGRRCTLTHPRLRPHPRLPHHVLSITIGPHVSLSHTSAATRARVAIFPIDEGRIYNAGLPLPAGVCSTAWTCCLHPTIGFSWIPQEIYRKRTDLPRTQNKNSARTHPRTNCDNRRQTRGNRCGEATLDV